MLRLAWLPVIGDLVFLDGHKIPLREIQSFIGFLFDVEGYASGIVKTTRRVPKLESGDGLYIFAGIYVT